MQWKWWCKLNHCLIFQCMCVGLGIQNVSFIHWFKKHESQPWHIDRGVLWKCSLDSSCKAKAYCPMMNMCYVSCHILRYGCHGWIKLDMHNVLRLQVGIFSCWICNFHMNLIILLVIYIQVPNPYLKICYLKELLLEFVTCLNLPNLLYLIALAFHSLQEKFSCK